MKGARLIAVFAIVLVSAALLSAPAAWAACAVDGDGDTYGAQGSDLSGCAGSTTEADCNDGDAAIYPGATELCDASGIDENCDGNDPFGVVRLDLEDEGTCVGGVCDVDNTVSCTVDEDCHRMCPNSAFNDPPGCSDGDPGGCCETFGRKFCSGDQLGIVCELPTFAGVCDTGLGLCNDGVTACNVDADCAPITQPILTQEAENDPNSLACHDGIDNDCDDLVDVAQEAACQQAEVCNGLDDDGDGQVDEGFLLAGTIPLGDPCTVGQGICENTGTVVCNGTQDAAVCSVSPGVAGTEGPATPVDPQPASCFDGKDNDCDGLADFPNDLDSCTFAEICDGLDNDGDGADDAVAFGLGLPCDNGFPPSSGCFAAGVNVCTADGSGVQCNAIGVAGVEGPAGETCFDGIDNDCDGDIDAADASCGAASLAVSCALPYTHGRRGRDCNGKHRIEYAVSGDGGQAVVTAELLALDANGQILGALPVENGDQAHLKSRLDPADFRLLTKRNRRGRRHQVSAPLPVLRVTAEAGGNRAQAFCSIVPSLKVWQPDGNVAVASQAQGDFTKVVAAIPLVDPASLSLKVDGVDLFSNLVPATDPTNCTGAAPCAGTLNVDGATVAVSELVVDSSPNVDIPSSNTLTMKLQNLGGGCHIFVVDGDPQAGIVTAKHTPECAHDDDDPQDQDITRDTGTVATFGLGITSPADQEITDVVPTPVEGQVRHGRMLEIIRVQGRELVENIDFTSTFAAGDGENSCDEFVYDISTEVGQTNLRDDVDGLVTTLGTVGPGPNRLVVSATDDRGNRAHVTRNFAVGSVASTAPTAALSAAEAARIQGLVQQTVEQEVKAVFALDSVATMIPNAFVLGVEEPAMDTFFGETCAAASEGARQKIREKLIGESHEKEISLLCDPVVTTRITDVRFGASGNEPLGCGIDLKNGSLDVVVTVPSLRVDAIARGNCCSGCDFICWHKVRVDTDATVTLPQSTVKFNVTEAKFLSPATEDILGQLVTVQQDPLINVTRDNNDVGCIAGFFLDLIEAIGNFFVLVFTFGQVDPPIDFDGILGNIFNDDDFVEQVKVKDFTIKARDVKVSKERFAERMKKLEFELGDVKINPQGLTVAIEATVNPDSEDPEIQPVPGALLTAASAPMPPELDAGGNPLGNVYFVVADDLFNQLFGGMSRQGEIKTQCLESTKTYGNLLRNNCNLFFNAEKIGICHGHKQGTPDQQADCDSLPGLSSNKAIKEGACHGIAGSTCETIDVSGFVLESVKEQKRQACRDNSPSPNLFADMPIQLCGRVDIPPKVLIDDNPATPNEVETHLRMQGFEIAVAVDRNKDMAVDDLPTLPACLDPASNNTLDCTLVATCLDINFPADLTLNVDTVCRKPFGNRGNACNVDADCDSSPGDGDGVCKDRLRIKPNLGPRQIVPREPGVVCVGEVQFDENTLNTTNDDGDPVNPLNDAMSDVDSLTPLVEPEGLDLGEVVEFENPRMIAVSTGNACTAPEASAGQPCNNDGDCGAGGECVMLGEPGGRVDGFQDYIGITGSIVPK